MNRSNLPSDDSFESDAVWKLLDQATPVRPRASFADDVVRMAKLEPAPRPWWKMFGSPLPRIGLVAATAAVILAVNFMFRQNPAAPQPADLAAATPTAVQDDFADLQDFAETETLIAAADHLDEFSDQELAGLIGF